jgi:integrase
VASGATYDGTGAARSIKAEQMLLRPFLEGKTAESAVFSPRTIRKAKNVGAFYTPTSYRRAVRRAVERANREFISEGKKPIPMWFPYMLRHQAASAMDKIKGGGKLAAQALLDHTSPNMTKNYIHKRLADRIELANERVNPFVKVSKVETEKNDAGLDYYLAMWCHGWR